MMVHNAQPSTAPFAIPNDSCRLADSGYIGNMV